MPRQYDPAKPACVYVGQDGVGFNAPVVFDQLIYEKAMPVTVGVFVTPGNASGRGNRSFEYDSMTESTRSTPAAPTACVRTATARST